jgi:hypothetical protein
VDVHVTTPLLVSYAKHPADVILFPPSSAVPVIAGRLKVTDPSAPVTGWMVTVPEVALPIVSDPRVPDAPRVGVAVHDTAVALVALGIVPAAALDAFVPPLAIGKTPETSAVRLTAELVTVWVDPAKWAIPATGDEATTHVAHAIVPVLVIVPPVIGLVVAMLVTVPEGIAPPSISSPPVPVKAARCSEVTAPDTQFPLHGDPRVQVAPLTVVAGFTSPEFFSDEFETFERFVTVGFG